MNIVTLATCITTVVMWLVTLMTYDLYGRTDFNLVLMFAALSLLLTLTLIYLLKRGYEDWKNARGEDRDLQALVQRVVLPKLPLHPSCTPQEVPEDEYLNRAAISK